MNARTGIARKIHSLSRRSAASLRASAGLAAVVALAFTASSSLQAEASVASLSLEAVLSRVASVHPQMQRARAEAEASRQQLEGARWARFPSVTLGAAGGEGATTAGSLRVQQPLYTFGRIEHGIDAAQASLEANSSGIEVTRRALIERAALAHARWLSGLEQLQLAERYVSRQQELLDFIARRADGGIAARGDTRLAQGRLDQARAREAALRANVSQARAELESLMLQKLGARPLPPSLPGVTFANAEALAAAFVDASPALTRLEGQQRAANAEALQRGADRLPVLVARVERSPSLLTSHYDTRALLALDYQSGAGLSTQADYRARLSRVDALRAEGDAQRRELELLAGSIWLQRATLIDQKSAIEGLVASSADTVESFMRQFDAGRRSWLDVLNAERELFDARLASAQIDAGLLESSIRIHAGIGQLDAWATRP